MLAIELPRYEAENAGIEGGAAAETNPFGTGWGAAELPAEDGAAVRFTHVRVPAAGTYTVTLYVANASDSAASVRARANGGGAVAVDVPAGERSRFEPLTAELKLAAGPNEIVLDEASGKLIIDRLEITSRK